MFRVNSLLKLGVGILPSRFLCAQALIKCIDKVVQNFICGAANAVRAGHVGITGNHCSCDTYQRPVDPYKIVDSSCSCGGGAVPLIVWGDGFFHIGPKLIEIADFGPELGAVQRNTGRHRLYGKIGVSVAVHYNGVCFVLACDVPLDWVCILDCGQADEIRKFGIELVQLVHNPIKIEIMEIGVGRFVNRINIHKSHLLNIPANKSSPGCP